MNFMPRLSVLALAAALPGLAQAVTYTTDQTLTQSEFTEGVVVINGADVTVEAENIVGKAFKATNHPDNVDDNVSWTQAKNTLVLGNESTKTITIANSAAGYIYGLAVQGPAAADFAGSTAEVNAENFIVNLHSEDDYVYGLYAMNASSTRRDENGNIVSKDYAPVKLTINAENTFIKVSTGVLVDPTYQEHRAIGIVAFSEGEIEFNGNLYVDAPTAIATRGKAVININKEADPNRIVQLNGDINFTYDGETSGTPVHAFTTINLTNPDSYLKGDIVVTGLNIPEGYDKVKDMDLGLFNGGAWYVPKDDPADAPSQTTAEVNLTMSGGLLRIEDEEKSVRLKTFSGEGGRIEVVAAMTGDKITHGTVQIDDMQSKDAKFEVSYLGLTADDVSGSEAAAAALKELRNVISAPGSTYTQESIIAEGDVLGQITEVVDSTGEVIEEAKREVNTKIDALSSLTALTTMQWRHEMNDLTKRMGELRDSPTGVGAWARVYGSEQSYGNQNVTLKSASVQVGADASIGDWKAGGAFGYTDGSADMDNGTADGTVYSLAAYGTWLAQNGMFVDLIGKYSWLESDFEIANMKGTADNSALSASVEFGWRFEPCAYGFIEPQAELTYGRIWGDDFTTSNGVKVSQDDFDALIGRLGVRAGVKFPNDKGRLYVRVSGAHDFKGDSTTNVSKAGVSDSITEDLGGSWVEYGLGANFNLTPATYAYVDLERTTGGDVSEKWRWNVGLRTVF